MSWEEGRARTSWSDAPVGYFLTSGPRGMSRPHQCSGLPWDEPTPPVVSCGMSRPHRVGIKAGPGDSLHEIHQVRVSSASLVNIQKGMQRRVF